MGSFNDILGYFNFQFLVKLKKCLRFINDIIFNTSVIFHGKPFWNFFSLPFFSTEFCHFSISKSSTIEHYKNYFNV